MLNSYMHINNALILISKHHDKTLNNVTLALLLCQGLNAPSLTGPHNFWLNLSLKKKEA